MSTAGDVTVHLQGWEWAPVAVMAVIFLVTVLVVTRARERKT